MPREHERSTYLNEVTLESASGRRTARISDVSQGGCFVDTVTVMRPGEEVTMICSLPSGEQLNIKGSVAYVMEGVGFGLSFGELDDETTATLQRILDQKRQT